LRTGRGAESSCGCIHVCERVHIGGVAFSMIMTSYLG
jgi:hypothetical protein